MKKIKLFLITLLCMVGVMNVDAQDIKSVVVNSTTGYIDQGNWYSNETFDGNRVSVVNNAWLEGLSTEFTNDDKGYLFFRTSLLRTDKITINAPSGYVVVGFKFYASCSNKNTTVNVEDEGSVSNAYLDYEVGNTSNTSFTITTRRAVLSTITCENFVIYFMKKPVSVDGLVDAYSTPIESGAMYVISTELGKGNDKYFSVNINSENRAYLNAVDWPSESGAAGFVNVNAVWEMTILDTEVGKRLAFMSMSTNKYLGDAATATPIVTPESKTKAMQFEYNGPITNLWWTWHLFGGWQQDEYTDNFYNLKYGDKYLSYVTSGPNAFNMQNLVNYTDRNVSQPQRFRFHRVDYVRIGVFSQQNGVLTPLHYNVTVNTGSNPRDNSNLAVLPKYGQSELCCEHNENPSHMVIKSIMHRVKNIETVAADIPADAEVKYIVNGEEVPSIPYEDIVHGYNISIIYVLPDTPVDPDDPDPTVAGPKFYKLKSKVDANKYLSVETSNNTSKLVVAGDSNDAIFYHEYAENGEKHLLSYTSGVYVKDKSLGAIEEVGTDLLLAQFPNTTGKWDVRMGSKNPQYLTCDSYDGITPDLAVKPHGEYELIPVTELPVKLNTVGDHRYGTFYAPVDVTVPAGLEAYRVDGITPGENADVLGLVRVTEIPANTGVILYEDSKTSKEYKLTITSNVDDATSLLDGVCPRRIVKDSETLYGLNKKSINGKDTAGFYKMKTGSALSPFRAFLDYTESEQGESKGFVFSFTELDAIEAIEMSHAEDAIYDLQGRKVQNPGTGIYIVNGKKIMVRK